MAFDLHIRNAKAEHNAAMIAGQPRAKGWQRHRRIRITSRVAEMTSRKHTRKVLIIDDNPVVCIFLEGFFKTKGYAVFIAETAQRGMDMALKLVPDLLMVQGKMPDGTGIGAISFLRRKPATEDIPAVYYTGSHKEKMRYKLNPPADTWYLHTPWDASRLQDILREDIFMDDGDEYHSNTEGERKRLRRKAL